MNELTIYLYSLHALFITFLILIALNFKDFKKFFKIKERTWWILLLLLIFSMVLLESTFFYSQLPYFADLRTSKEFYLGAGNWWRADVHDNNNLFGYFGYICFSLIGIDVNAVIYLKSLFFFFSGIAMFLLAYLFSRDEKHSLLSVLFFASVCSIVARRWEYMIYIYYLFSLLFLLFSMLSYKLNTVKSYSSALVTILMAATARFELILLLPSFFIGLLFYRWKETRKFKKLKKILEKISLPSLIFTILSSSYLLSFYHHFLSNYHRLPGFGDVHIKRAVSGFSYFFSRSLFFFIFGLSIFGLILTKQRKKYLLPLLSFLSLLPPYLLCSNCFESKYGAYLLIFIIPYIAIVISRAGKWFKEKNKNLNYVFSISLAIILIFSLVFSSIPNLRPNTGLIHRIEEEKRIGKIINGLEGKNENVFIITSKFERPMMFFTLKDTKSLTDIIKSSDIYQRNLQGVRYKNEIIAGDFPLFYDKEALNELRKNEMITFNKTIKESEEAYKRGENPLNIQWNKNIYFVEYPDCAWNKYEEPCRFMHRAFNMTLLYESDEYKLYRVTLKGEK